MLQNQIFVGCYNQLSAVFPIRKFSAEVVATNLYLGYSSPLPLLPLIPPPPLSGHPIADGVPRAGIRSEPRLPPLLQLQQLEILNLLCRTRD